jgi:hypothetical protein
MAVLTTLGVPDNTGNTTTIMPKLQYRFRVTFIGAGFSATPTRSVVSAGRPTLTHDAITLDAYNSRIYLAGKHTWGDVAIILRDDVDSAVMKEINQQMNRQVDHANQSSSRSGSGYKFTVKVETLDGASPTPGILDTYELSGCYIQGVTYGDLNYATNEQITMTVTLKYDNAEIYDAAGNATLTGITPAQNTSNATGS